MRHQVSGKHLGRTSAHRLTLRRNLAASLFEHGTISTTIEKAKFVRPFAEKLITLARDGSLHARRRAIALLQDRDICTEENGEPVFVTTVISKLFDEIGPRFADRNGGYTRIVRLPLRRVGDNGQLAMLQLVGELGGGLEEKPAARETVAPAGVDDMMTETPEEETAVEEPETAEDLAAEETPETAELEEQPESEAQEPATQASEEEKPETGETDTDEEPKKE